VNSEQLSVNSEQLSVNSEQLSVNSEQLSVNSEQLSVNSEQLAVNSEQLAVKREMITDNCSLFTEKLVTEKLFVNGEQIGTLITDNSNQTAAKEVPLLKIDKKTGDILITDRCKMIIDNCLLITEYKLGNRSAIEWVLDQYKPYKSDDKTIQEQFNNYNFADYKEEVIELLQKVCWISVETMKIVKDL
jgi:predicted helicase